MAFDDKTRNRLNSFVTQARELLTKEFTQQCQVDFGLNPKTGEIKELASLRFDDEKRQTAIILRETIAHYYANLPTKSKKAETDNKVLIERVIREQAFTILNRLCAVRMAEARDLIIESVAKGVQSKGFQLYQHVVGPSLGETAFAYEHYLFSLFDEFAIDLAVLFDRFSPQGRLFPRDTVVLELIGMINDPEINHLWAEDETIGWIYQYFNSREERKAMRDASQAPRNSRELAVRNQFFTPRYVVEFLTDNTLGRIWYEIRQGNMPWVDDCKYLVRRPDEVFLAQSTSEDSEYAESGVVAVAKQLQSGTEEDFPEFTASKDAEIQRMIDLAHTVSAYMRGTTPSNWEPDSAFHAGDFGDRSTQEILDELFMTCRHDRHGGDGSVYKERWFVDACNEVRRRILHSRGSDLSQEEMLRAPVIIPYRPLKDPRDIRMLDPACGSMHFGLYAFDLYLKIYDEYWDLCHNPDFRAPATEHRLPTEEYADKAAWMKAAPKLIIEHNIHGIDIDPRAVQIAGLSLWLRAQRAWKAQGLAAAVRPQVTRSNVVCAEPMPGDQQQLAAFCKTLHPAIAQMVTAIFEEMKLAGEAGSLLKIEQEITGLVAAAKKQWEKEPKAKQLELFGSTSTVKEQQLEFDLSGITDEQFFEKAEEEIYGSLRKFASETSEGGFRRKLFAGDAEKGFAFLELCNKSFDVSLMNPPFGDVVIKTRDYVSQKYEGSKSDIGMAFVSCNTLRMEAQGLLGAITNRVFIANETLADWRCSILLGEKATVSVLLDLGYGVLDGAKVEAAAYTVCKGFSQSSSVSFIRALDSPNKETALSRALSPDDASDAGLRFTKKISAFESVPGEVLAYQLPNSIINKISSGSSLSDNGGAAVVGLQPSDDFRFVRLAWEVPVDLIGKGLRWVHYAKGGEYRPYWDDIHLVVLWGNDGYEIKNFTFANGKPRSYPRSQSRYYMAGVTYPERTTSDLSPRVLPADCIFSGTGQGVFPGSDLLSTAYIAGAFSRPFKLIVDSVYGSGDASSPATMATHYRSAVLARIPSPIFDSAEAIGPLANELIQIGIEAFQFDETSRYFSPSYRLRNLETFVKELEEKRLLRLSTVAKHQLEIEKYVFSDLAFTDSDVASIDNLVGPHPESYEDQSSPSDLDRIRELMNLPMADLIKVATSKYPPRRQLTMKSYIADRRIELISHILKIRFSSVCLIASKHHLRPPGIAKEVCEQFVSYLVGVAFGRWKDAPVDPAEVEPFSALPPTPPAWNPDQAQGVFQAVDGKESLSERVSELIREYGEIEQEICGVLGKNSIGDYVIANNGLFDSHLSMYSKSRRSAPIYWPISTESGSYTLWFYYHRLTDQTLFQAVNDFVDPKLKETVRQLAELRGIKDRSSAQETELGKLTELESELQQFKADLLEIAAFWKPNLNDGVQITAAPLWKFFRHTAWRNKLKKTWEELQEGKYDWAHLVLSIWPERVVKEKCTTDRSIAIAHDLEDQLWHEVEIKKTSKTGKVTTKTEWQPRKLSKAELDAIVAEVKRR